MQGLHWVSQQKVSVVGMSKPVLKTTLRALGSTFGVTFCLVMFVGHHIDSFFENRSKIVDVAEFHNLITVEKASALETQTSIHHWSEPDHQWSDADRTSDELADSVSWDREILFNLKALRPVERALRYAKAELHRINMKQVPHVPHV